MEKIHNKNQELVWNQKLILQNWAAVNMRPLKDDVNIYEY